jgi:HB1, ASXL, restriction endonuclease HTH domain
MKYYEAAIEVLKAAKRPLTVEEITNQAVEAGLIAPHGKTPAASMSAVLYRTGNRRDLIKLEDRGEKRAKRGSVRWTLRPN